MRSYGAYQGACYRGVSGRLVIGRIKVRSIGHIRMRCIGHIRTRSIGHIRMRSYRAYQDA